MPVKKPGDSGDNLLQPHQPGDADWLPGIYQELGFSGPKPGHSESDRAAIFAFRRGLAGQFLPQELISAGIVKSPEQPPLAFDGTPRAPFEVQRITVNGTADKVACEYPPNYRIHADGTIEQLRSPDLKLSSGDNAVTIQLDDGQSGKSKPLSEAQKESLKQILAYAQGRYGAAEMSQAVPPEAQQPARASASQEPPPLLNLPLDIQQPPPFTLTPYAEAGNPPQLNWGPLFGGDTPPAPLAPSPDVSNPAPFQSYIDRVVDTIGASEGKFTTITWHDGNGKVAIGKGQFNQSGEMADLMWGWYHKDPKKFQHIFGRHWKEMLNSNFIHQSTITKGSDIGRSLEKALSDTEFQEVQTNLLREKVIHAFTLASKYKHTSDGFVAQVADLANQCGWGGVEHCLKNSGAKHIADEHQALARLQHAGVHYVGKTYAKNRQDRDKRLSSGFSERQHSMGEG